MNDSTEHTPDVLSVPAPANSLEYAEEVARQYYGIQGKAHEIICERDQLLMLQDTQGQRHFLRFINPAEPPRVSDFQTKALLHVAEADPGLPVPRVVPTLNGDMDVAVPAEDGRTCIIRLITCVPGMTISELRERSPELHRDMGATLARLDLALSDFSHPAAKYDLIWDLERADGLRNLLSYIEDEELREMGTVALDGYSENVLPVSARLRRQVIHNDFNLSNVLVDRENPDRVAGVIDFSDMIQAPIINEVAVSLYYHLGDQSDTFRRSALFLMSYHQTLPLETAELDLLYDLVMARGAMSVAISEWRIAEGRKKGEDIFRSYTIKGSRLYRLAKLGREEVRNRLFEHCKF